jgi:hypothetical protein
VAEDDSGDITDLDQQVEAGHKQEENIGEQYPGGDEERPERLASHPTQHYRSQCRRRDPCQDYEDPGQARSEPPK